MAEERTIAKDAIQQRCGALREAELVIWPDGLQELLATKCCLAAVAGARKWI